MSEDLFQPSLTDENYTEKKTYNISKLFYVALFGGIIPTVVLATRNATWLGVDKKKIMLLGILGAVILISQMILVGIFLKFKLEYNVSLIYRVLYLLLYLGYYLLMKKPYEAHVMTGGKTQPLLKTAVIWIVIGVVAELIFLLPGGVLISNVL